MIPALEKELAAPVGAFLGAQGYETFFEVYFNGRIADVIAVKGFDTDARSGSRRIGIDDDAEVVAVELKLRDYKQALRQAMAYQVGCHRSYVGVPLETALLAMRRARHDFEKSGTGLLAIEEGDVRELLPARLHETRHLPFMADALRELRRHPPLG